MQRYAASIIKHYQNVKEPLSKELHQILSDTTKKPLDYIETRHLSNYFLNKNQQEPGPIERQFLLTFLIDREAYQAVETFGKQFLFVNNNNNNIQNSTNKSGTETIVNNINHSTGLLKKNASTKELKLFLFALVKMRKTSELDLILKEIISQISVSDKSKVINLINSILMRLQKLSKVENSGLMEVDILHHWVKWILKMEGSCEYTDYMNNKKILGPILKYMQDIQETDASLTDILKYLLTKVKEEQGASAASQLSTTLIYLLGYNKSFNLIESIWDYKNANNLTICASDLTAIMRSFNYTGRFHDLTEVYAQYPQAHNDATQFDYMLLAHAKTFSWQALKEQFEALFGIGMLPNVRHYEIVIYSMARLGNIENVEKLYAQYLRRGMLPTYSILQSVLECHYKADNPTSCFQQFQLFEKYSIEPTVHTYMIMFKIYQKMNDISGALRLLKTITEERKVQVTEQHFVILMQMCSRVTNPIIAKEIFSIMNEHYDIRPTAFSVSALMNVYLESRLYGDVLKIFDKYSNLKYINQDSRHISLYNKAILAYINMNNLSKCDELFEKVSDANIPKNSEFYKILLMYMVNCLKNYDGAEEALFQLVQHPSTRVKANVQHFEVIMAAYARISHYDGIFKLYKKMTDFNIPVNSKVLYYLVKATFKTQMSNKEDLSRSIEFVDKIMESAAADTLHHTGNKFHPSIMAWALRTVAKYYNPQKALEMLNRYDKLFYDSDSRSVNNKLVLMKSLVVLFGELNEWEEFEIIYNNILNQLERYEKLPSSTVPNKKLTSIFVGIFTYRIRHLTETHQLERLPSILETLNKKHFILDNISWNQAVSALFSNPNTIEYGLMISNKKLIHGYNLLRKSRLLKRLKEESLNTNTNSWFLEKKLENPKSFIPKLYLKSDTYTTITKYLDEYLNNNVNDIEVTLKQFIEKYGYFMKSYLMTPRVDVNGWDSIEKNHQDYLNKMREMKRVIPANEF